MSWAPSLGGAVARLGAALAKPEAAGVCPYCRNPFHASTHLDSEPCGAVQQLIEAVSAQLAKDQP